MEDDVEAKMLVGHLDAVAHQATGSRSRGEALDRRHSLGILSVEGASHVNSHVGGGYRGHRRRGLGDAGPSEVG